jgi:hypothetical protein
MPVSIQPKDQGAPRDAGKEQQGAKGFENKMRENQKTNPRDRTPQGEKSPGPQEEAPRRPPPGTINI